MSIETGFVRLDDQGEQFFMFSTLLRELPRIGDRVKLQKPEQYKGFWRIVDVQHNINPAPQGYVSHDATIFLSREQS